MYKKLLVLHYLILQIADQEIIRQTFVVSSLFILVCEDKTCVLQISSKCTGGDPYGNMISIKLRSTSAWVLYCNTLL